MVESFYLSPKSDMTSILDRNTLPRKTVVENNYRIIAYNGPTPGADSNIYVLFNSVTALELQATTPLASIFQDHRRYVLSLKNSQAGTLNAYGSMDSGNSWYQYFTQPVAASASTGANNIDIPLEPHMNVKVEWVNGGVAQATWVVAQALDAEESLSGTAGGPASSVTVTNFPPSQPVTIAATPWSIASTTNLASSLVIKNTAGTLRSVSARIDSTASTNTLYVQLIKATSLPANGAVTLLGIPVKMQHISGQDDYIIFNLNEQGVTFSPGLVVALSLTEFTLTLAGNFLSITAEYL